MTLSALLHDPIRMHAEVSAPRECCGLIVRADGAEKYLPCRNIGGELAHFAIHPDDYAAAEDSGEILAVVHSHVHEPATPSAADVAACNAGTLPWLIVNHPTGAYAWLHPEVTNGPADLVGRAFVHGVHDCYALVRDWYWLEWGLQLRNYPRFDNWWERGENLYLDNFAAEGFMAIPLDAPAQRGDALLMQVGARICNHAAIDLADGTVLHHVMHRMSKVDVYGEHWRRRTTHRLRHQSRIAQGELG